MSSAVSAAGQGRIESFERMPLGAFSRIESPAFTVEGPERGLVIVDRALRGEDGGHALRVKGGGRAVVRIVLPTPSVAGETLRFRARRLAGDGRFDVSLAAEGEGSERRRELGAWIPRDALRPLEFALPEGAGSVELTLACDGKVGLLLDDLERAAPTPMEITRVSLDRRGLPVLSGASRALPLGAIEVETIGAVEPVVLAAVEVRLEGGLALEGARATLGGERHELVRAEGDWWRAPLDLALDCGPLRIDVEGDAVRSGGDVDGDATARAGDAPAPGLARDAVGRLDARLVLVGREAPVDAAPRTWSRTLCTAAVVVDGDRFAVDAVAVAPHGITQRTVGSVVAVAALRAPKGSPFLRILRWSAAGELTERDLRPADPSLGYVRPALILDRRTGEGALVAETVPWPGDRDASGTVVAFRTEDGGATFGEPEDVDVTDDDDAAAIGGSLRLQPGRGVIEGSTWALPILRSHGHPRCQAALLVSEDAGATWIVSTGVHDGARSASAVALGEQAILVEARGLPGAPRAEQSTLNSGVWWLGLSETRPPRPASPEGVAWVHVGRETGWGPDGRLLYACAPEDAPHGLVLRGTNDYGSIWHVHRRAMLDDRAGAGAPGLALIDADRIAVLFRSGEGDLLLQVRDLTPHAGPLQSLEGLFGPR